MRKSLPPTARFISRLRLTAVHREVLSRMDAGDLLKHYDGGALMLHTSAPDKRATLKLSPVTMNSLMTKGLIECEREGRDKGCTVYTLTEDGAAAGRILRRADLPSRPARPGPRKSKSSTAPGANDFPGGGAGQPGAARGGSTG